MSLDFLLFMIPKRRNRQKMLKFVIVMRKFVRNELYHSKTLIYKPKTKLCIFENPDSYIVDFFLLFVSSLAHARAR